MPFGWSWDGMVCCVSECMLLVRLGDMAADLLCFFGWFVWTRVDVVARERGEWYVFAMRFGEI